MQKASRPVRYLLVAWELPLMRVRFFRVKEAALVPLPLPLGLSEDASPEMVFRSFTLNPRPENAHENMKVKT